MVKIDFEDTTRFCTHCTEKYFCEFHHDFETSILNPLNHLGCEEKGIGHIYMFIDPRHQDGLMAEPCYVGKTIHLLKRWMEHCNKNEGCLVDDWTAKLITLGLVPQMCVVKCVPDLSKIYVEESEMIWKAVEFGFLVFNKQGRGMDRALSMNKMKRAGLL